MTTWTDDMGKLEKDAGLEEQARAAVCAAVDYVDAIPAGTPRDQFPYWTLGTTCSPRNDAARAMHAAIVAKVAVNGQDRLRMVAVAVRYALFVRANGGGAAGWSALVALRQAL